MPTEAKCPKCGGEMDEGKINHDSLRYTSDNTPSGFFSNPGPVDIHHARACLTCGFLELYVNPQELAKKIAVA